MNQASLIPELQSDALVRELERQFNNEAGSVIAAGERDAHNIIRQACADARRRVHEATEELRREGARRLAGAKAQLEAEQRARAQQVAAQAVHDGFPLLREELEARWRDRVNRRQWTDAVARVCVLRLRPGGWLVEHPADWSEPEQRDFRTAIDTRNGIEISFKPRGDLKSGLLIKADQAVLDATTQGLLADGRTVAALILNEIGED